MEEIIEGWVTTLSPIHEAVSTFEKGGHECGRAIMRLYQDLLKAEHEGNELQGEIDSLHEEVDDLESEINELKEEISELKKESGNGK